MKWISTLLINVALTLASNAATAAWIYANDYTVGTDVSNPRPGVQLTWIRHESGAPVLTESPVVIGYSNRCRGFKPGDCNDVGFGGPDGSPDAGLANGDYAAFLETGSPTLDQIGEFTQVSVSLDNPAKTIGVSAFSTSSDLLLVFLFDSAGVFREIWGLNWEQPDDFGPCQNDPDFYACWTFSGKFTPGFSVGSFAIGATDSPSIVDGVFYDVPAPGTVPLVALLVMVGARKWRGSRGGLAIRRAAADDCGE